MTQENKPKILANCELKKLKEYSRSYGGIETLSIAFIKERGGEITTHSATGLHLRTFRKGTKLLIDFRGEPISERQFVLRTNKAKASAKIESDKKAAEQAILDAERAKIAAEQSEAWAQYLCAHPEKAERYKSKVKNSPSNSSRSGNWRNWLRMKAAKKIAGEKFSELVLSASGLRDILFQIKLKTV